MTSFEGKRDAEGFRLADEETPGTALRVFGVGKGGKGKDGGSHGGFDGPSRNGDMFVSR